MKDEINVGVVGCGYWGPNLIRNFASLKGCKLKSVCDQDESRLDLIASRHPGIETFTRFDVFLDDEDLDAVVIAVPVRFHFNLAFHSLKAGKHVFIEKPMAASVEECNALIELADEKGLILMVGHTFLYSPVVRKIKEIVDSGEIGKIQYISCRRLNLGLYQQDINVAWDLAPHDLSIILHLIDSNPVEVNCRGKTNCNTTGAGCENRRNCRANIPDVSNMTLVFDDGCFATVHNSWLDPRKVRDMAIIGDRKMIVYDELQDYEKVKIFDRRIEPPVMPDESRIAYHYGDMWVPYIPPVEPLHVECSHFIECIQTGQTPLTDGRAGRDLVEILTLASESMYNSGNNMLIGKYRTLSCGEVTEGDTSCQKCLETA
ncbi:Gfo/Idh/MocA family protein [Tichowtungia aerotolerans]|uniref:Gfo/Idh/MocA family oxidoreductase n=1 Tax=Tichowtungia aerotolerans TaxID=2697043 RepID=A0A6P1M633_9BACT|nr:Gfo/Idh/MocA family oxidoreductase [Tichowtungia aerotolerans]QHI70269.1 Gfo/Idh/MocA family oxidoreductase [Tichowtungia aerotolerans]